MCLSFAQLSTRDQLQLDAIDKGTSNNQHNIALTHKLLDSNGFVLSTVATYTLILKHKAISISSAG